METGCGLPYRREPEYKNPNFEKKRGGSDMNGTRSRLRRGNNGKDFDISASLCGKSSCFGYRWDLEADNGEL